MAVTEQARNGAQPPRPDQLRTWRQSLRARLHSVRRRLWRTPAERVDDIFDGAMRKMRGILERRRDVLPLGSPNRSYVEHLLTLNDEQLLEWYGSLAHANPDRVECPPYRVLLTLATSEWGSKHPAWEHVHNCYPCIVEVRTMHRAHEPRPA